MKTSKRSRTVEAVPATERPQPEKQMYNVEIASMTSGSPLGANVRVLARSEAEARCRAAKVVEEYWEGITIPDYGQLDDGECVRIYVDPELISTTCPIEIE